MKTHNTDANFDEKSKSTADDGVAVAPITFILATMAVCVFWLTHP